MTKRLKILGINGSASQNSSNLSILNKIAELGKSQFDLNIIDDLTELPHFKTELTDNNVPEKIIEFRNQIENADGIIICTPEYVFSIPSGLKNAIEWCVSTAVFSDKPIGLITASASGEKGHEELKLIMKTVQTNFTDETTLLIQGIKGKINNSGEILDDNTKNQLEKFVQSFNRLNEKSTGNTA
ncbi:NAD(P)H-dependent FMN reductase [Aquimarina sp. MAR_2010_214]|uniref:NADPH-dependent FMN reductase n=1 Tax=Aquimarina sp. MAR_2010_214 TaxID=1250026 RepID=UPI000C70E181|nr:NAD(P)H-dependent oxidoreductase [Aquimarina sp. MAR_2010_214]PKV52788.1 NAD(P)H-dependent FMN reductase [Aquimarina sp. MAR_2010_214]